MSNRIQASQFLEPLRTKELPVPELDGTVLIRELSATERLQMSSEAAVGQDQRAIETGDVDLEKVASRLGVMYPYIIASGMVDPQMEVNQVKKAGSKWTDVFMNIALEILQLSGLVEESEDDNAEKEEDPLDPKA